MPTAAVLEIRQAVAEFEEQQTEAAIAAHDADRLDCLLQALEYCAVGATELDAWIDSSRSGFRTATAHVMAEEALTVPPGNGIGRLRSRIRTAHKPTADPFVARLKKVGVRVVAEPA